MGAVGTEELIRRLRERYPDCTLDNRVAARLFVQKGRRLDAGAYIVLRDRPCVWGDAGAQIGAFPRPKTAGRLAIHRSALPALVAYVDRLGRFRGSRSRNGRC
jgi:hypothetical protein